MAQQAVKAPWRRKERREISSYDAEKTCSMAILVREQYSRSLRSPVDSQEEERRKFFLKRFLMRRALFLISFASPSREYPKIVSLSLSLVSCYLLFFLFYLLFIVRVSVFFVRQNSSPWTDQNKTS